jgi:sigma-B regulation protein RsbU (phosphoserine phosphatase)
MKYRYAIIIAALFFIASMAVQFVVSYRRTMSNVQDNIDLKTEVAYEKILFELYDAYEVIDLMKQYVANNQTDPDIMLKGTSDLLERYPSFYCLHVDFPEYYYKEKGKWFSPYSYRVNDSIISRTTGDEPFDYFQREWYKGALNSGNKGYWSKPYWSDVVDNMLFTHSDNMVDKNGKHVCVVGIDFSIAWMQELMEEFKPFDDAVCLIYSTDGKFIAASENLTGQAPASLSENDWIVSRKTFDTIDIEMVLAVPKWHVWKNIIWTSLWSLIVLIAGVLVIGIFIRRMLRDQKENARLETEKEIMAHEMQIAHDIQMGILRYDFPHDDDMTVHADLLPVREVGGDLYDFSRKGDELWFIIGDVSGKGVPAAMFMSAAVNLFRSALGHLTSPKSIMEEMNAVLSENNPSVTFVTAFIGRLNISSGHLAFCNAGHLPPLVKGTDGSVIALNMDRNFPLGFDGNFSYIEDSMELREDEKMVLYTDGVTEAENAAEEMMGSRRWIEIVSQSDDLLEAVKQYIGEAEQSDDITLMTICRNNRYA